MIDPVATVSLAIIDTTEIVALKVGNVRNVAETTTPHDPAPPPRNAQNTGRKIKVIKKSVKLKVTEALTISVFSLRSPSEMLS